jgi:hypothetical protein
MGSEIISSILIRPSFLSMGISVKKTGRPG